MRQKTYDECIAEIKELISIQKQPGNYNCDEYMYGMLVGMECILFCLQEDMTTPYTPRPEHFINSLNQK